MDRQSDLAGCCLRLCRGRAAPIALDTEIAEQRRGDEDRRVGADQNAEQHGKAEITQDLAAEEVERKNAGYGGQAGEYRARERLVDRDGEQLVELHLLVLAHVLADAVGD